MNYPVSMESSKVDKLILGTVQFGLRYGINNTIGIPSENKVFEIFDLAYQNGITILDTADGYGKAPGIIGKYLINSPNNFLINTKFRLNCSPLAKQVETFLTKLNIKKINVYFYHSFNDFINYPKFYYQLLELKAKGKINQIGLSVYDNEEIEQACQSDLIDVIQLPFNLFDNYSQRGDLIKAAKDLGKEIQTRSVFLQGLFFINPKDKRTIVKALQPQLTKINKISEKVGVSVATLALTYCIHQPFIDNVLVGVDSINQLQFNINAAQHHISEKVKHLIDQIRIENKDLLNPSLWENNYE